MICFRAGMSNEDIEREQMLSRATLIAAHIIKLANGIIEPIDPLLYKWVNGLSDEFILLTNELLRRFADDCNRLDDIRNLRDQFKPAITKIKDVQESGGKSKSGDVIQQLDNVVSTGMKESNMEDVADEMRIIKGLVCSMHPADAETGKVQTLVVKQIDKLIQQVS